MPVDINETVKVMAIFDCGVKPVKFKWKGRVYPVKEITHSWRSRDGDLSFVHFSVSDGQGLYELVYDTVALNWTLGRTDDAAPSI
ncbi:MAG: hypothetical protein HY884_01290 [Deltaproteobacteria bacterium]|nr:hypothetical protein [Deltaproteobacteria bacterium]